MSKLFFVARGVCFALALSASAVAAPKADRGPEMNPYECLGRYEAATGNRSMSQVQVELEKRLHPLFEPDEPHTVRAMKLCVVAMLESRLGNGDAPEHYAQAIAEDPSEPGYELFYGMHYSGFRGARGPVLENAESHFYAALRKLDELKTAGRARAYHDVVDEWVHKRLLVLYQEDGLHVFPWKAYAQEGDEGLDAPGVSLSGQVSFSKDTRNFFRNNEMRLFTGELQFAQSAFRATGTLSKLQIFDIARAPLRFRTDDRLRIRQNAIGAFDLTYAFEKTQKGQISSYYKPPGSTWQFSDTTVTEIGLGYERVIPLYPLLDFKLAGDVKHIDRQGIIEFLPYNHEKFYMYEARPSFSRFVGPDKVTLDLVYSYMNVTDVVYGVPAEQLRSKYIRAVNLEYALYSPLVLPEFRGGALGMHRTPTRGWYFNAGAADDDDVYGTRIVHRRDYYAGTRFEGAGNYDLTLQGTYATAGTTYADANDPSRTVREDPTQKSSLFRTTALVQRRIINPDAIPGIPSKIFAVDLLNVVVPITWDKGLTGPHTYENVRVGAEVWAKAFGTGFLGPAFLATAGYDYQYFYNIQKSFHEFHVNLRMGWDKL